MTHYDTTYFEIKDSGDFLRLDFENRTFPDAEMDLGRNWIKSKVTVKAGGFSGQFETEFQPTDFGHFRKELERLFDNLSGYGRFYTLEEQVEILIKGDGVGHFVAKCEVRDKAGMSNTLNFEIAFDQTQIPELVRQLDNIMTDFPILGDLK